MEGEGALNSHAKLDEPHIINPRLGHVDCVAALLLGRGLPTKSRTAYLCDRHFLGCAHAHIQEDAACYGDYRHGDRNDDSNDHFVVDRRFRPIARVGSKGRILIGDDNGRRWR